MLFDDHDLSIILEKRGNTVRFAYLRMHDRDTTRILEETRQEYFQKRQEGYIRKQVFEDFLEAQEEIQQQRTSS